MKKLSLTKSARLSIAEVDNHHILLNSLTGEYYFISNEVNDFLRSLPICQARNQTFNASFEELLEGLPKEYEASEQWLKKLLSEKLIYFSEETVENSINSQIERLTSYESFDIQHLGNVVSQTHFNPPSTTAPPGS